MDRILIRDRGLVASVSGKALAACLCAYDIKIYSLLRHDVAYLDNF